MQKTGARTRNTSVYGRSDADAYIRRVVSVTRRRRLERHRDGVWNIIGTDVSIGHRRLRGCIQWTVYTRIRSGSFGLRIIMCIHRYEYSEPDHHMDGETNKK